MTVKKRYTVGEVSKMTGVSTKTLHHYQKIELLEPEDIGENNYRYYSEKQVNLLHEILVYRSMNIPLADIKELLKSNESKTRVEILTQQLAYAKGQRKQISHVMDNLRRAIKNEKRGQSNGIWEQFEGLVKEYVDGFLGKDLYDNPRIYFIVWFKNSGLDKINLEDMKEFGTFDTYGTSGLAFKGTAHLLEEDFKSALALKFGVKEEHIILINPATYVWLR